VKATLSRQLPYVGRNLDLVNAQPRTLFDVLDEFRAIHGGFSRTYFQILGRLSGQHESALSIQ
jgi:hypothetical protein